MGLFGDSPASFVYNDRSCEIYAVGEKFPIKRKASGDGSVFEYLPIGPAIISFYSSPTMEEIHAYNNEAISIGLFHYENVLEMITMIGANIAQCPFNINMYNSNASVVCPVPVDTLHIFLVDADTMITKVMRVIQMPPYFGKNLHRLVHEQEEENFDFEHYAYLVNAIDDRYSIDQMFEFSEYKMYSYSKSEFHMMEQIEKEKMKNPIMVNEDCSVDVIITKNDIDNGNIEEVYNRFARWMSPDIVAEMKQNIHMSICGYGTDIRELYEIPEVREFIKKLDRKFPYWFYLLSTEDEALRIISLCYCNAEKISQSEFRFDEELFVDFSKVHFQAMNKIIRYIGESEKEATEMFNSLQKYFFGE